MILNSIIGTVYTSRKCHHSTSTKHPVPANGPLCIIMYLTLQNIFIYLMNQNWRELISIDCSCMIDTHCCIPVHVPLTHHVGTNIEAAQNWLKLSSDTLLDLHQSLEVTIGFFTVSREYHFLHSTWLGQQLNLRNMPCNLLHTGYIHLFMLTCGGSL